jgi:hypothetical protein
MYLTAHQRRVLAYLVRQPKMPTRAEIGRHMGWTTSHAVLDMLLGLAGAGAINGTRRGKKWVFWIDKDELE